MIAGNMSEKSDLLNLVERYVFYLLKVKGSRENTVNSYKRDIVKMNEFFSKHLQKSDLTVYPDEITGEGLGFYVMSLKEEGMSAATVSRRIASIRGFYDYLLRMGEAAKNPADNIKAPRIEKKAPEVLSIEEIKLLLMQPSGDSPKEIRDKAMLELLYATGMKVSELLSLKVSDVNMLVGCVQIYDDDKSRVVPIEKKAMEYLKKYIVSVRDYFCEDSDMLFVNTKGEKMSRQGFWKLLKHYAVKAGISKDITPHTIRHSFAAHLVDNGAELIAVQELMGYSQLAAAEIYVKDKKVRIKEAYDKAHKRPED